jgi:hypothetical protein
MAEVVFQIPEPVVVDGRAYTAQVCGRPADVVWEGWIEFESTDGAVLRTARETTQPDRAALVYWATGLSATYLEGAFSRALHPSVVRAPEAIARPHFDEPAPTVTTSDRTAGAPVHPVLDPFSVAEKGESLLRQELSALHAWRLRDIVRAYELADASVDLEPLTHAELIEFIVSSVLTSYSRPERG